MVAAINDGRIPRAALTAEIIRQLRNLKNAEIDADLQKVYGTIRESSADSRRRLNATSALPAAAPNRRRIAWSGRVRPDLPANATRSLRLAEKSARLNGVESERPRLYSAKYSRPNAVIPTSIARPRST